MDLRPVARAALPVLVLALAACSRGERPARQSNQQAQQGAPPAIRYDEYIAAGGRQPPGAKLSNPHKGDKKAVDAGGGLFVSMNCDGCHGGGATGWVGPSLADGRWRYGGADDEIFQSIFYGRPHGMPAFGGVLPADAVWMLVAYLQSLPAPATVPTQSWEKR